MDANLRAAIYAPNDVMAATGVTLRAQQAWHARQTWLTPTTTPLGGKPRELVIAHVYEAGVMQFGAEHGQPLATMKAAIEARLASGGLKAAQTGRAVRPVASIADLPEVAEPDPASPVAWAVRLWRTPQAGDGAVEVHSLVESSVAFGSTATVEQLQGAAPPACVLLLPITAIVLHINRVLRERLEARGA